MRVSNDDLLYALQQRNLVYNHNFLYFSNKVSNSEYNHPDGWNYEDEGSGGEINFDPKSNSCIIQKSGDNSMMSFRQVISEFPRWRQVLTNQIITTSAIISNPSSSAKSFDIQFALSDGASENSRHHVFNPGDSREISIDISVSPSATNLEVLIESNTSGAVIYIEKVFANIGKVALHTLPCMVQGFIGERKQYVSMDIPPAEELSLCKNSEALSLEYTRLSSFLNGKFGIGGDNNMSKLPDMRGYFSRAWDNGADTDPDAKDRRALYDHDKIIGDVVGSMEDDEFLEHDHELKFAVSKTTPVQQGSPIETLNSLQTSKTEKSGGLETRSKNIAELYTIKWA